LKNNEDIRKRWRGFMPPQSEKSANSRINAVWEKFAIWACSAIIALLVIGYQDQKSKVDKMEEKVQFLFLDKVSKQDMDKLIDKLEDRIAAGNSAILARMDLMVKLQKQSGE
jgi:hypothetical protein